MRPTRQFIVAIGFSLAGCVAELSNPNADTESVEQSASVSCKNALSPVEEKTALKLIEDICGDTWCEGDNNFAFQHLTCRSAASPAGGSCTLKLRIIPRDDSGRSYPRSCTTGGFSGFDSLVDTAASGYQALNWDYYLALTECISQLEAAVPN